MFEPGELNVRIFADCANMEQLAEVNNKEFISGFTTNPTLMRKSGISDYMSFARDVCSLIGSRKPISFEVFSDDFNEMEKQANILSNLGENVYVKIPIMNSQGEYTTPLIRTLDSCGVQLNVTAIVNPKDAFMISEVLGEEIQHFISIFAGRISDTGIDPVPSIKLFQEHIADKQNLSTIWASPREIRNLLQANSSGCHVITLTKDLIDRISLIGKDLSEFTVETVQMFHQDAMKSSYKIH